MKYYTYTFVILIFCVSTCYSSNSASCEIQKLCDKFPDQFKYMPELDAVFYQAHYIMPSDLESILKAVCGKNISVIAEDDQKKIIFRLLKKDVSLLTECFEILKIYDTFPSQILVEAVISEITFGDNTELNGQFSTILSSFFASSEYTGRLTGNPNNLTLQSSTINATRAETSGIDFYLIRNENLYLLLEAQKNNGNFQVVSTPRIITSDKKTGIFNITQTLSSLTGINTHLDTGQTEPTVVDETIQSFLAVHPRILSDGNILLNILLKIEDPTIYNSQTYTLQTHSKSLNSKTIIPAGYTLILGGYVEHIERKKIEKVPFLSALPLIGKLFRKKITEKRNIETVIFITPEIIEPVNVDKQTLTFKGELLNSLKNKKYSLKN